MAATYTCGALKCWSQGLKRRTTWKTCQWALYGRILEITSEELFLRACVDQAVSG